MADTQQQYGGAKAELPELLERQLGYCLDTEELYIGGTNGNVLIGSGDYKNKLSAVQVEAISTLGDTAQLTDVITAFNTLINNLKTAGLMK